VQVDTPNSISETAAPEDNVISIFISGENKVYFNVDNGSDTSQKIRSKVLEDIGTQYRMKFTEEQKATFAKLSSFGMPVKDIPAWIEADAKQREEMQTGIPIDSVDNQLAMWVLFARKANPKAEAIIKGDMDADYKTVKRVLDIMQDYKIDKFNLITNLEKVEVKLEN
jgi:biopolymer transport protein ExbD